MANPYRHMLANPGAVALMITSFFIKLPQAMVSIGLITMLVQHQKLYWLAGGVAATYTLVNAFLSPQISKLVDRLGQSRVLPFVTAFSLIMLLILLGCVHLNAALPWYFIFAALSGTMPNMSAMARARWAELFRGRSMLHTAFSLDSVLTEAAYVIGPTLAIGLSTSLFAEAGPLLAVVILIFGLTVFLCQRKSEPRVNKNAPYQKGSALAIPSIRLILLSFIAMGTIGGSVDVVVVAFAKAQHIAQAASFILAAYAFGSMVAGLVFGLVRVKIPMENQLLISAIATSVTIILPAISPNVMIMTGAAFIAGMSFAPTVVIVMSLCSLILPSSKLTEGITWVSTGLGCGVALGGMLSGRVIDSFGARAGFCVPVLAGFVVVFAAILGMRVLRQGQASLKEIEVSAT
ncbi:MFS transporter [Celerinatantimonas sp. MCCC 1A17872]|uniref:MFS transporter n=1 Tax=Celerinatantimonas sp. MCCC 1A17872 TaxID=3177514 RepID=UPI0038C1CC42